MRFFGGCGRGSGARKQSENDGRQNGSGGTACGWGHCSAPFPAEANLLNSSLPPELALRPILPGRLLQIRHFARSSPKRLFIFGIVCLICEALKRNSAPNQVSARALHSGRRRFSALHRHGNGSVLSSRFHCCVQGCAGNRSDYARCGRRGGLPSSGSEMSGPGSSGAWGGTKIAGSPGARLRTDPWADDTRFAEVAVGSRAPACSVG